MTAGRARADLLAAGRGPRRRAVRVRCEAVTAGEEARPARPPAGRGGRTAGSVFTLLSWLIAIRAVIAFTITAGAVPATEPLLAAPLGPPTAGGDSSAGAGFAGEYDAASTSMSEWCVMTHGATERRIRIRIDGDDARDLRALHSWLSLEEWFGEAEAAYGLKVVYREGDGTEREARRGGPPMGGGLTELVLVIAGAALAPAFEDLYGRIKVAIRAWEDNTSSDRHRVDTEIEAGDAPAAEPASDDSAAGHDTPAGAAGREDGEDGRTR